MFGGISPAIGEEVAQAQQVSRLQCVRLIVDYRFERRNGLKKFVLPVIGQADVQPDARDLRHQVLCVLQSVQSFCPLPAPHIDDAEIGVGGAGFGIDLQHLPKIAFGIVQLSARQSVLSALKNLRRIGSLCFRSGSHSCSSRARTGSLDRRTACLQAETKQNIAM